MKKDRQLGGGLNWLIVRGESGFDKLSYRSWLTRGAKASEFFFSDAVV